MEYENKVLDEIFNGRMMTYEDYCMFEKLISYRQPKEIIIGKKDNAYIMDRKCPNCGLHFDRMNYESKFCPNCGKKLKGNK